MAAVYRSTPAQLRAELERRGGMDDLRGEIRNGKTLDFLLQLCKAN